MDATFWATVALVIFLGLVIYLGVPGMIGKALDERATKIRTELDEARKLKEEALALKADYERRRTEAEDEAKQIVEAARREAADLAKEAEQKTADDVARRTALAEARIARAEGEAVREVKAAATDIAVAAAARLIRKDGDAGDPFEASLEQVKTRLN